MAEPIMLRLEPPERGSMPITIYEGATISAAEVKRVTEALKRLNAAVDDPTKDPHAPREVTVTVTLRAAHREYPTVLYKGKQARTVQNAEEQAAAAKDGFGPYDHEAFTAKEA